MIRFLPFLIELSVLVYCLIDCVQSDTTRVRNLPKLVWALLIIAVPLVGGIAWLIAGRPERQRTPTRSGGASSFDRPAPKGPDDDPEFMRQMRSIDAEHERTLKQWEDDLRERERKLKGPESPTDDPPKV